MQLQAAVPRRPVQCWKLKSSTKDLNAQEDPPPFMILTNAFVRKTYTGLSASKAPSLTNHLSFLLTHALIHRTWIEH